MSFMQAAEHRLGLERELHKATKALREAENDLRKERQRNKPDATPGTPNTIFRRVGLDPSAPRFAIEAARKAYRKSLHPDLQPPARKAEAERRFKEAEAAFDEIWRIRQL
jgi:DnaJ-class molecular chaperone